MPFLRLGTRASPLARWQAQWVAAQLRERGVEVDLVPITTAGDLPQPPRAIGGQGAEQGIFTKEIQRALLDNRIDLAVHSLKDLPTGETSGLSLAAVPQRGPVADVLVLREGGGERGTGDGGHTRAEGGGRRADDKSLSPLHSPLSTSSPATRHPPPATSLPSLPPCAIVGTGSVRRRAQLLHVRPDLQIKDVRGNVETRLRKLEQGDFDALVLAEAGLRRLGLDQHIAQVLPLWLVLPAVGQGALALETRTDDNMARQLVGALDHPPTHVAVLAEREMLSVLQGGCLAPIAALGCVDRDQLTLTGRVIGRDGAELLEATDTAPNVFGEATSILPASACGFEADDEGPAISTAIQLGRQVAEALLAQGAAKLIEVSRTQH